MNIIVSACLVGTKCRYDAGCKPDDGVLGLIGDNTLIPVCPEQFGGLATPRSPAERRGERVFTRDDTDVTYPYTCGANEVVRLAKLLNCRYAVLKSKSPSCGNEIIYDGSFSGQLVEGDGVTAQALKQAGIKVFSELQLNALKRELAVQRG